MPPPTAGMSKSRLPSASNIMERLTSGWAGISPGFPKKGCDWIVANDVSDQSGVLGGEANQIHLVTEKGVESWPLQTKEAVAGALVKRIADALRRGANS